MPRRPTGRKGREKEWDNARRRERYQREHQKHLARLRAYRAAHREELNAKLRAKRHAASADQPVVESVPIPPISNLADDARQEAALAALEGRDPKQAMRDFYKQERAWLFVMQTPLPSWVTGDFSAD